MKPIFYTKLSAALEIATKKPLGNLAKKLDEAGLREQRRNRRAGYQVVLFESDVPLLETLDKNIEMILVALNNLDEDSKRAFAKCSYRVLHIGFEGDEEDDTSAELTERTVRRIAELGLSLSFAIYRPFVPPPLPKELLEARKRKPKPKSK